MFLTSLYNQGKGYSCINLTRSAVATLLFGSKISVGMHPLVKNLLEECLTEDRHSHGTQLRGTHILCLIFYKVVLLCLLLSGQRGQALWLLDLCNITWSKTDIRCTFESISKISAPNRHQDELVFGSFPEDKSLCVVHYLHHHKKRTCALRGSETKLFISWKALTQVSRGTHYDEMD